ncbi:unnamed protein product, partial [marine sediment metagenome]
MSILIDIKDLKVYFPVGRSNPFTKSKSFLRAVDGISFKIHKGESLGLVGESGSGKTTLGRSILRLIEPTNGQIIFKNKNEMMDIVTLRRNKLRMQWRHMQMIFQDPYSSLNQRMTVK